MKSPFPRHTGPVLLPTLYLRRPKPQDLRGLEFFRIHGRAMTRAERFATETSLEELRGLKAAVEAFPMVPPLTAQELEAFYRRERELGG